MSSRAVQVPLQVLHSTCQEQLVWSKGLATEQLQDKARRPSETSALREAGSFISLMSAWRGRGETKAAQLRPNITNDTRSLAHYLRFGSQTESSNVRFTPKSGHCSGRS